MIADRRPLPECRDSCALRASATAMWAWWSHVDASRDSRTQASTRSSTRTRQRPPSLMVAMQLSTHCRPQRAQPLLLVGRGAESDRIASLHRPSCNHPPPRKRNLGPPTHQEGSPCVHDRLCLRPMPSASHRGMVDSKPTRSRQRPHRGRQPHVAPAPGGGANAARRWWGR